MVLFLVAAPRNHAEAHEPAGLSAFDSSRRFIEASFDDPLEGLQQQRLGMGLPLCRLYTKYLGGSLKLMSVPGTGVWVQFRVQ